MIDIIIFVAILFLLVIAWWVLRNKSEWLRKHKESVQWLTLITAVIIGLLAFQVGVKQNSIDEKLFNLNSLKDRPVLKIEILRDKEGRVINVPSLSEDKKSININVGLKNIGNLVGRPGDIKSEICLYDLNDKLPEDCLSEERFYIEGDGPSNLTGITFPGDRAVLITSVGFNTHKEKDQILNIIENNQRPVMIIKLRMAYYSAGDIEKKKEYVTKVRIKTDNVGRLGIEFLDAS